ncbi:MAG TPA: phosphatase PAP2 family protein [Bryobacteraceae bacterium]|nr:phosphatase PAP2 family protein [Bryobacteraceae bacterium]
MSRESIAETTETLLKVFAAAVIVAITCASVKAGVYRQMVTHPTVFCLMLDCFLIHILTNATRREALVTTGIAAATWLAWPLLTGRNLDWPWDAFATLGCLLGVSSLFVLTFAAIKMPGAAGRNKLRTLGRGSLFLFMAFWSVPFLKFMDRIRPEKLDAFLYRFDASFGVQPSFFMGRVFAANPSFHNFEFAIYLSLAVPAALVYIGHLRHEGKWPLSMLRLLLLNSLIGFALFAIFPAAGPSFAFPRNYPFQQIVLPIAAARPVLFEAFPNAIPSVHISTVLLIWFNSRPWPLARAFALFFVLLTIVSTLGLGEHYVVDVIVAFPYALGIQGLCTKHAAAKNALLTGSLLTAGWLLMLRFAQPLFPSAALAWILMAGSIALTLWMESKLAGCIFGKKALLSAQAVPFVAANNPRAVAPMA